MKKLIQRCKNCLYRVDTCTVEFSLGNQIPSLVYSWTNFVQYCYGYLKGIDVDKLLRYWDHIPQHNHWWGLTLNYWLNPPYSQSSSFNPLHHSQLYILHSSYAQCTYLLALIFWRAFNALPLFGAHCLIVSVTGEAISLVHHNALVVFLVFNIYIF